MTQMQTRTAQKTAAGDDLFGWYAAQLRPNSDKLAMTHLQRQGFAPFRPLIWERLRRGQATASVLRPMFPGYVFVKFDISQPDWGKIRSTRGISRLIGTETCGPYRLPTDLIASLKSRCASNLPAGPTLDFKPGDLVHIASGPFADFLATVEKVSAQQRVWVLIDFMGRTSRISANPDQIIPQMAGNVLS